MFSDPLTLPSTLELKIDLTEEQFFQLCRDNGDLRFERTATGKLIVMPLRGSDISSRNADLTYQLTGWNRQNKLGIAFDSSTGFTLPNSAVRSPDASWIKLERWNSLTPQEKERFAPICPDFVAELISPSDSLKETRDKMREYMDNESLLGWLINRKNKQVEIYRPNQDVEILQDPTSLSGEDVLPGFVLDLSEIL